MSDVLPAQAEVVVVGGGAVGCAVAWALTREGITDVALIEKAEVTHGSTWHAAGLVGQYRSREDLTRLMQSSVSLMDEIEAETPIGWRRVGSLRLASSSARMREYVDAAPRAKSYGVGFDLIGAAQAKSLFPYIDTSGVEGAAFVHGDGYVDPTSLTRAYASRARRGGVRIVENATVGAIRSSSAGGSQRFTIETTRGTIRATTLVLAPGVWARPLGRLAGIDLAVAALEHQYAVTAKRSDMPRDLPALRDPDLNFYVKPETGAFAIGGWEENTPAVFGSDMPFSFGRELLPESLDRLQPIMEAAIRRLPVVGELGLRTVINGPIPVTPDGEPILGPCPGRPGVYLATGFTSGIASSAGAGKAIAQWIARGEPEFPIPSLDPARFAAVEKDSARVNDLATRAYASYYALSSAGATR